MNMNMNMKMNILIFFIFTVLALGAVLLVKRVCMRGSSRGSDSTALQLKGYFVRGFNDRVIGFKMFRRVRTCFTMGFTRGLFLCRAYSSESVRISNKNKNLDHTHCFSQNDEENLDIYNFESHDFDVNFDPNDQNIAKIDPKQLKKFEYPEKPTEEEIAVSGVGNLLFSYRFPKVMDFEFNPDSLDDHREDIHKAIKKFIDSLGHQYIYKALLIGILNPDQPDEDVGTAKTPIFITHKTSPEFIAKWYIDSILSVQKQYEYMIESGNWLLGFKEWLTVDQLLDRNRFDDAVDLVEKENTKFHSRLSNDYAFIDKEPDLTAFRKWINVGMIGEYNSPEVDIKTKPCYSYMRNEKDLNIKVFGFEVTVSKVNSDNVLMPEAKWRDFWINKELGLWLRLFSTGIIVRYNFYKMIKLEVPHKTRFWKAIDQTYNEFEEKFGVADIESFTLPDGDFKGQQIPYACGFKDNKDLIKTFYYEPGDRHFTCVVKMVEALLHYRYNGHTFFIHNMMRFDSPLLLSALGQMGDQLRIKTWGRSIKKIFKIRVSKRVGKKEINVVFLDSLNHLPVSLDSLGKSFECVNKKSVFPHAFVKENNLFYCGKTPDISYYDGKISKEDYQKLIVKGGQRWELKAQSLMYLERDLQCHYEVMYKYCKNVWREYLINPVKVNTLPAMVKLIYLTWYYNDKVWSNRIPTISGKLDKWIRRAYKGGIVDIPQHLIKDAVKYDVNSHYPAAMLQPMPVGTPRRVYGELVLDNIFGFCDAEIVAPSEEELRVPILPTKNKDGILECPRGTWRDCYFSEELKNAVKNKYKVKILSAVEFDKGFDIFKGFIEDMFNKRAEAKKKGDHVRCLIYKLMKNSLYGKAGQKEIDFSFNFVQNQNVDQFERKYNTDLKQRYGSYTLIRSAGLLPKKIRELARLNKDYYIRDKEEFPSEDDEIYRQDENPEEREDYPYITDKFVPDRAYSKVNSSVPIAAATTAYGRIRLSVFKNIPGNKYLGGDTDSANMEKPLPEKYIGPELGLMKLEYRIKKGLQADKKLYYVLTDKGEEIIRSRGVGLNKWGEHILSYKDFLSLMKGETLSIKKLQFKIKDNKLILHYQPKKVRVSNKSREEIFQEMNIILSNSHHHLFDIALEVKNYNELSLIKYHVREIRLTSYINPILFIGIYNQIQTYIIKYSNSVKSLICFTLPILNIAIYNLPRKKTHIIKYSNSVNSFICFFLPTYKKYVLVIYTSYFIPVAYTEGIEYRSEFKRVLGLNFRFSLFISLLNMGYIFYTLLNHGSIEEEVEVCLTIET